MKIIKYIMKRINLWILLMTFITAGANGQSHHTRDGFRNPDPEFQQKNFADFLKWSVWERVTGKKPDVPESYHFPVIPNDGAFLRQNTSDFTITWVGHSTLLVQIDGINILTDPVWSERCSPVQFAGPKRHVKAALRLEDLPEIDLVIISHDHYDHLDKETIKKLGNKPFYLVPLGIGDFLADFDINRYQEFDWWDTIKFNGLEIVCTPARHFSGRNPMRQNSTLWASWVVLGKSRRFYFGGDSGYFKGFKEIGQKYGPFDVAALPIGAYRPRWFMSPVHISPEEAVQAFIDLNGINFVPIHWGTFSLADEALDEPPAVLRDEINKRKLDAEKFWILKHGETRIIDSTKAIVHDQINEFKTYEVIDK